MDADPDGQPATDKDGNPVSSGTGVTGGAKNNLNQIYNYGPLNAQFAMEDPTSSGCGCRTSAEGLRI
jgi:hypothetical protein